ncbi:hypothetical protein SDJN02_17537, partial [Cucurbita argyrosperma subsp. argyrosperma]
MLVSLGALMKKQSPMACLLIEFSFAATVALRIFAPSAMQHRAVPINASPPPTSHADCETALVQEIPEMGARTTRNGPSIERAFPGLFSGSIFHDRKH